MSFSINGIKIEITLRPTLQRYDSRDRKSTLYGIRSSLSINSTCLGCNGTDVFHVFSKNIPFHRVHTLCWISLGKKPFVAWATTWYEIVFEMLKPIKHTWACTYLHEHTLFRCFVCYRFDTRAAGATADDLVSGQRLWGSADLGGDEGGSRLRGQLSVKV